MFLKQLDLLYGPENLSYNVHNLIHLCSDSEYDGVLDNFSTFKFENHSCKIKNLIRSGNRQLEPIFIRIHECQLTNSSLFNDRKVKSGSNTFVVSVYNRKNGPYFSNRNTYS